MPLTAKVYDLLPASPAIVWKVLTDPEQIKKYFFGTNVTTDWHEGSPITWNGIWNNKPYQDKGVIQKVVPYKFLQTTYWSNLSGLEDIPENYLLVTYELEEKDGLTQLTITQENCATEEMRKHSEETWTIVLNEMKKILARG